MSCLGLAAEAGGDEQQKLRVTKLLKFICTLFQQKQGQQWEGRDGLIYKKSIYYIPYLILPDPLHFLCPDRKESKPGRAS